MFSIIETSFGSAAAYRLVNKLTEEYVEIVPACGGIINAFAVKNAKGLYNVIDGFKDSDDFLNNNKTFFKSNFLFPFANRIRNGKFSFKGKEYQLNLNFPQENNAIHGLVYDRQFRVENAERGKDNVQLKLKLESEGFTGFPFPFEIKIVYIFSRKGVKMEATVINRGEEEFPYGLGWHHYFRVGKTIDKATLQFPAQKLIEVDDQMIPNGKERFYYDFKEEKQIAGTRLDTCFFIGDQGQVKIPVEDPEEHRKLVLAYDSRDFPYLQVYTPDHRETIAIEPMTCAPDVFNNHSGIRILKPGEEYTSSFFILIG